MDEAQSCRAESREGFGVEDAEVIEVVERGDARDPPEDCHEEGRGPVEGDDRGGKSEKEAGVDPEEDLVEVGMVKSYNIEGQRGGVACSLSVPPAPVLRGAH